MDRETGVDEFESRTATFKLHDSDHLITVDRIRTTGTMGKPNLFQTAITLGQMKTTAAWMKHC